MIKIMNTLLNQAIKLYSESFSDGKEYVKYFFEEKFSSENFLYIKDKEQIISELFLVEKRLFLRGAELACPYVVGACTKSERRGEGLMNNLLFKCFDILEARGTWLTALYPFRHSFYEQQGFVTLNRMRKSPIISQDKYIVKEIAETDIKELNDFYISECAKSNLYIKRSKIEFYAKVKEVKAATGKTYAAYKGGILTGYIMFDNEEVIEALGIGWQELLELKNRNYYMPDDNGEKYAMLRLIKVSPLLPLLNYPIDICANIDIRITDAFRRTEDEIFTLSVEGGKAILRPSDSYKYTLTIEEITLLVSGAYVREGYSPPPELADLFPPTKPLIYDKY